MCDPLYLVGIAKISILKKEGIVDKICYVRHPYESVDDRSLSCVSQKSTENKTRAQMG